MRLSHTGAVDTSLICGLIGLSDDLKEPRVSQRTRQNIIMSLSSLVLILLVLEVCVRLFIPVPDGPLHSETIEPWRIVRRVPGQRGRWARGAFGQVSGVYHINHHGWNSVQEYQRNRTPGVRRVVVIGDSVVEALQVDADEGFVALTQDALPDMEIYRFGMSGAPLSQYPHMARYVQDEFVPDLTVVLLVANDYEGALSARAHGGVFWRVESDGDGWREVPPLNLVAGSTGNARQSALGAYVDYLLLWATYDPAGGDVAWLTVNERESLARYILSDLYRTTDGALVLMTTGGAVHDEARGVAETMGVDVIDLTPILAATAEATDFLPLDGHWNERGHEIVADVLVDYLNRWRRRKGANSSVDTT